MNREPARGQSWCAARNRRPVGRGYERNAQPRTAITTQQVVEGSRRGFATRSHRARRLRSTTTLRWAGSPGRFAPFGAPRPRRGTRSRRRSSRGRGCRPAPGTAGRSRSSPSSSPSCPSSLNTRREFGHSTMDWSQHRIASSSQHLPGGMTKRACPTARYYFSRREAGGGWRPDKHVRGGPPKRNKVEVAARTQREEVVVKVALVGAAAAPSHRQVGVTGGERLMPRD